MPVAKGVEYVGTARGRADYRQSVGDRGPVSHPDGDALRRQVARERRVGFQRKVPQDLGAAPIGGGLQSGQFDLPRDAQRAGP